MNRFANKTVLITGAARGQGAEEARHWVAEGGKVIIGDIVDEYGLALAEELGSRATYLHLDVSCESDWAHAVDVVESDGGGLYGLVNNAAIFQPESLNDTSLEAFDRHIRVNQIGCFLGMKFACDMMKRPDGGAIVNVASTAGLRGTPGAFAYSATKWAMRGMTRAAAATLAPRNIRVNSIYPGPIDTDMIKFRSVEQAQKRIAKVPLGRMGTATEVAAVVMFLLSEQSAYMTGAEVAVDGGSTI
jgi:3alpha(or 20beta)-hydroxysteroid dehydrogenase